MFPPKIPLMSLTLLYTHDSEFINFLHTPSSPFPPSKE